MLERNNSLPDSSLQGAGAAWMRIAAEERICCGG